MATGETYGLKVGDFSLLFFADGGGPRQATGFLPDAPPDELERIVRGLELDPDALDFSLKPIFFHDRAEQHFILIDTGLGNEVSLLPDELTENGVELDQINLVIITHGHGDHINGILDWDGEFNYPNATYVLTRAEWDYWTADERFPPLAPEDEEGYPPNPQFQTRRVWAALKAHPERVRLLDEGEMQILPGVRAVPIPGHTVGQIAVEIESNGEKFLHVADAAHHYFQLNCPQWSPKFDYDPVQAAETRRAVFENAADEGLLFSAYHFPFPGVGRIVRQGDALRWQPHTQ